MSDSWFARRRGSILVVWVCVVVSCAKCETPFERTQYGMAKRYDRQDVQITKVSLTQKGYIQFLRYTVDVPQIEEFTYCIWLKSHNFTYPHPLLSYSKNEHERLIRGWIAASGKSLNLEILNGEVYSIPTDFVENQWYHICQSWDSRTGIWMAFIDGRLRETGIGSQLTKTPIPDGGDIVVGQEYTDFEKGLDDGIEGDVFGFNLLLLAPAQDKHHLQYLGEAPQRRRQTMNMQRRSYVDYYPEDVRLVAPPEGGAAVGEVPGVLGYFNVAAERRPKGFLDFGRSFINMLFGNDATKQPLKYPKGYYHHVDKRIVYNNYYGVQSQFAKRSLAYRLVEESYGDCAKGKGSPIRDEKLLVSWTKTPVRVFGGALLKLVPPFCIKIS